MKKLINSLLLLFTMLTAIVMSGCDALENFLFDLPIDFQVTATDGGGSTGGESYCLTDNETYNDYVDKLNSITLVEAHIVTQSISSGDENIQGDGVLNLYEGTGPFGAPLITVMDTGVKPADHFSPNGYKINLTQSDIEKVNNSLANGNTCFYANYVINNVSGANGSFSVVLKVDVLFQLDTSL